MSDKQFRQPAQHADKQTDLADSGLDTGDPLSGCADGEFTDANSGLIDELEQILRGDADAVFDSDPPGEAAFASFPLAEPNAVADEPPESNMAESGLPEIGPDPWQEVDAATRAFASDEPGSEPGIEPIAFDEPELPQTHHGSPAAPFWEAETNQENARPQQAFRDTGWLRRRDVISLILLVALIAGGATFSAIQLTRDPVVIAASEPDAEAAPAALASDTPEAAEIADGPETPAAAAALAPRIVDVEVAPPTVVDDPVDVAEVGEPAPASSDDGRLTPEEIAAVSAAISAEAETPPQAPARNAIAAEEAGEPPILAFADAGGPDLADPLAALSGVPAGGNLASASQPGTPATANSWVNMRSGPDNDAAIITVVAAGAEVSVMGCNFWCEVVVDGQQGWIYQDFLDLQP